MYSCFLRVILKGNSASASAGRAQAPARARQRQEPPDDCGGGCAFREALGPAIRICPGASSSPANSRGFRPMIEDNRARPAPDIYGRRGLRRLPRPRRNATYSRTNVFGGGIRFGAPRDVHLAEQHHALASRHSMSGAYWRLKSPVQDRPKITPVWLFDQDRRHAPARAAAPHRLTECHTTHRRSVLRDEIESNLGKTVVASPRQSRNARHSGR